MRATWKALLVAAILAIPAQAFAWGAHLTGNTSCAAPDDDWITWPQGIGTLYASGTFGGATITAKFQTIGLAAVTIDTALIFTSSMPTPRRLDFGAGQKVCWELTGASGTTAVDVEIHPYATRTTDGNLKERY